MQSSFISSSIKTTNIPFHSAVVRPFFPIESWNSTVNHIEVYGSVSSNTIAIGGAAECSGGRKTSHLPAAATCSIKHSDTLVTMRGDRAQGEAAHLQRSAAAAAASPSSASQQAAEQCCDVGAACWRYTSHAPANVRISVCDARAAEP
jgi:hypothetical protein